MPRQLPQPLYTGGVVRRVRPPGPHVDLPRDGFVDHGLLLFGQQHDQLFLGADVAPNAPVGIIEEPHDGGLFREGWDRQRRGLDRVMCKAVSRNSIRPYMKLVRDHRSLYGSEQILTNDVAGERPKQCQMVATDRVVCGSLDKSRHTDIVPCLRVLCDEHVPRAQAKSVYFV